MGVAARYETSNPLRFEILCKPKALETSLHIPKIDCSAEENLVRLKLKDLQDIGKPEFDLPGRSLIIQHQGPAQEVFAAVESLGFGARMVSSRFGF
jgi:hypothetical protein